MKYWLKMFEGKNSSICSSNTSSGSNSNSSNSSNNINNNNDIKSSTKLWHFSSPELSTTLENVKNVVLKLLLFSPSCCCWLVRKHFKCSLLYFYTFHQCVKLMLWSEIQSQLNAQLPSNLLIFGPIASFWANNLQCMVNVNIKIICIRCRLI